MGSPTRGTSPGKHAIAAAGEPDESYTYTYNPLDELLTADRADVAGIEKTFTYDASGNGNMLSQTGIGAYAYPAATAARPHGVLLAGGKTFTVACPGEGRGQQRQHRLGRHAHLHV